MGYRLLISVGVDTERLRKELLAQPDTQQANPQSTEPAPSARARWRDLMELSRWKRFDLVVILAVLIILYCLFALRR